MAEAVVDERPPLPTRFYCHMCSMEINIPNTDFTCPHCAGGFVEELPPQLSSSGNSATSLNDPGSSSSNMLGLNRLVDLDAIRGEIETLLTSRNGPIEIAIGPANRRGNVHLSGVSSGSGTGQGGGRVHAPNLNSLDNVLLDFLQSLSGGDDGGPLGNPQMFFMGNPGDYAWGREGIDTIVTQLLNQMETSGPPPLAKDKIDEIPQVQVTGDEVDRKLQCSVCWEDFRADEIVRKLPCAHIYHENCIVPWLRLHGTCPICRQSLSNNDEAQDNINVGAASENVGNAANMLPRSTTESPADRMAEGENATPTGGENRARNTSNTQGAANTSQTRNQSNNVFGFDDSAVDLD